MWLLNVLTRKENWDHPTRIVTCLRGDDRTPDNVMFLQNIIQECTSHPTKYGLISAKLRKSLLKVKDEVLLVAQDAHIAEGIHNMFGEELQKLFP